MWYYYVICSRTIFHVNMELYTTCGSHCCLNTDISKCYTILEVKFYQDLCLLALYPKGVGEGGEGGGGGG